MTSFSWCLQPIPTLASALNLCYILFPLNCLWISQIALKEISSSQKALHKKGSQTGTNLSWFTFTWSVWVFLPIFCPHVFISILWSRSWGTWGATRPVLALQIWCLMASLLTPKRTCCCCYYHQLWPWFAKHFYFASCLNAFPFWHDSQIANRCFQLRPCLFCFLFNGLFPRWGSSLQQAASWLVIGMTFQNRYCLSRRQEKPTHSGFLSSKCWKNRGRQNNRQYGLNGRSFCSETKAGYARNWIPEYRIRLCKTVALALGKGRFNCLETAKQTEKRASVYVDRTRHAADL